MSWVEEGNFMRFLGFFFAMYNMKTAGDGNLVRLERKFGFIVS